MKPFNRNKLIAVIAAACCLLGSGMAAAETTSIDKQAEMDPRGRVSVSNVSGKVDVEGWNRSQLQLTGTLGENVERLDFDADGGDVHIEVILKKGKKGWNWRDRSGDSNLKLKIPVGARLSVDTVSADIKVRGHEGSQNLDSVSGEITARLGNEDADIESVSGTIELMGGDAEIELSADAVSGDIKIRNFNGDVEAEAVSGDIIISSSRVADGDFESVSGDIDLSIELTGNGGLDIETVSGDVVLRFDGDVDASFEIDSHSGSIDDFWGHESKRTSRYGPGEELNFSVGSGRRDISITTLSGDIENRSGN